MLLAGCGEGGYGYGPKQTGGAALGAVGGGLLGAYLGEEKSSTTRAAATALGAVGGLLAGGGVGGSLDRADRLWAQQQAQPYQPRHQAPSLYGGGYAAPPRMPPAYQAGGYYAPPAYYPPPTYYYPGYGYP
jgi:hypothetical protein